MPGKPVAHLVVDALKELYPRAVHLTELAHATGLKVEQVSSSLNNRVEGGRTDVERVQRGVWKYVPPTSSKSKTRATREMLLRLPPAQQETAASAPDALPKSLKVVGTTSQGLLAVDPSTNASYIATKM